jgi:hypothetical protein
VSLTCAFCFSCQHQAELFFKSLELSPANKKSLMIYGNIETLHLTEKRFMKKIKMLIVIATTVMTFVTKAEAQKKPPPPPPPPPIAANENIGVHTTMSEFLKNNPAVKDVYREEKDLMVVELKSGKIEKYDLEDSGEKKSFVDKYGDVPKLPPPPPPKNKAI